MSVRVLIIEDSPIVQQWMRATLSATDDLVVIGCLESGDDPRAEALLERADVVLLDLLLPARSGLSLARELVGRKPVVVVSDAEPNSPMVAEALARGAKAYLSKRDLAQPAGKARLLEILRNLEAPRGRRGSRVIALVGSTGALAQHSLVLEALRDTLASVVLLQHMPVAQVKPLVGWVASLGWQTEIACDGAPLLPRHVLIAPDDRHLVFVDRSHVGTQHGDPVDGHRPSGTLLVESGKRVGSDLLVAILSGLGCDGAGGVRSALDAGAEVLTPVPESCAAGSMPRAALATDPRVRALALDELAAYIRQAAGGPRAA